MAVTHGSHVVCEICGRKKAQSEAVAIDSVREAVVDEIRREHPGLPPKGYVCLEDLNEYRTKYVARCLETEKGDLTTLEEEVVQSLKAQETLSRNINSEFDSSLTFGQKVADKVADFGGSWNFIISFALIIGAWITLNSIALLHRNFDPFPFILLNLVLSCLAAIQAPVIMMSQNRQEAKDRMRAEHDYQVNLKAEIEVRNLSEKLDHMLHQQWQRLIEIQQIQTDLMQELAKSLGSSRDRN